MVNNIISILDNSEFWTNLVEFEKVLYLHCVVLNLLQRDKTKLYDVLYSFEYFMQCTLKYNDENYKQIITK